MSYEIKQAKKRSIRSFYPLIGLILLIISGAIAFFGYEPLTNLLLQNGVLPPQALQMLGENLPIAVGGLIFLLVTVILTLLTAIVTGGGGRRRDEIRVSEKELEKERAARMREEKAAKQRKMKMRQKMAEQRRRNRE